METDRLPFIAYEVTADVGNVIERASARRDWMDTTPSQYAYRCLPLVIANQAGWMVRCPAGFSAMWSGGRRLADISIIPVAGARGFARWTAAQCVQSHFGEGVLTFTVPYLFRTPPGYNLWVKGPANSLKDGIGPLEGIVETDWTHATFTMNWKFTRANHIVSFEAGEPICQIVPFPRGLLERFDPEILAISSDASTEAAFKQWQASREGFIAELKTPESQAQRQGWEKAYTQGRSADGSIVSDHQTRLGHKEFVKR